MFKYVAILVLVVVLIAGVAYWLHSKIKTQEQTIQQLVQTQLALEAKLIRPPQNQEVLTILKSSPPETETCEDCELKPILPMDESIDTSH